MALLNINQPIFVFFSFAIKHIVYVRLIAFD